MPSQASHYHGAVWMLRSAAVPEFNHHQTTVQSQQASPDKCCFLHKDLCYLPQSLTKAITDSVTGVPDKLAACYRELTLGLLSVHLLSVIADEWEAERSPFCQFNCLASLLRACKSQHQLPPSLRRKKKMKIGECIEPGTDPCYQTL